MNKINQDSLDEHRENDATEKEENGCCCDENCSCDQTCTCNEECSCGENCECNQENKCSENCTCQQTQNKENEYLDLARRVQADFDNYRRHVADDIRNARISGQSSVIEVFLPCLDNFKEAKKLISDPHILQGVEMIEEKINETLKNLGVEKIESVGQIYDPSIHNVIAVMKDEDKENDIILDEYQAGYKFGGKVIRYAKVIVNKKED